MTNYSALAAVILMLLMPLVGAVTPAQAQPELWLDPTLGRLIFRAEYRATLYPEERVERQPADLAMTQHRLTLASPLWQNSRDEWSLSASARLQDFDTRAILPDTAERFPDELWDIRLGATYRHKFDNGWMGGGNVTVGSASDEPFASEDEVIVRATAFLRIPHGERNAWFLTLNYSNYQDFLSGVPIPGVAYVYAPSERFQAVIGLPFSSLEVRPLEDLTFQLTYAPVRNVRFRATYQLFRPLRLYAGFDWDSEYHLRAGRGDDEDRLFYYEKRLIAGIRFDLRHVGFELSGGYAFDRFYFEGERYSDRGENRLDIADGPFVAARVGVRF